MPSVARSPRDSARFRKRAEELLTTQTRSAGPVPEAQAQRLLHELQVHQIELEMQNTELLETRERLATLLTEFTDLYNFAPVGYLTLDAGGIIRRANLMAATLLGVDRGRLSGRSLPRLLDPGSRGPFSEFLAAHFSGKGPGTCELALAPGAGAAWIRLEATFSASDQEGQVALIDISETREAHAFLKNHQEQLERLVSERTHDLEVRNTEYADLYNRAPCGYHSLDAQGTILAINDTMLRMVGYTREEVVGRMNIRDLLDEVSLERFHMEFPAFLRAGFVRDVETNLKRRDGSVFPALVSADTKLNANGKLLCTLSTVVDNTLRKEAELKRRASHEELERQVLERTRLVRRLAVETTVAEERERRAIAHDLHDDLGQLLHMISHQLDMLGRAETSAERQPLLAQMKATLAKASRSVRSLTTQLSPPVLETLGLVSALFWLAEEMEQTYGLRVEIVDDGSPKPLSPNLSTFLFRAARELLINVAKHSGGKTAVLRTTIQERRLVIQVDDRGQGIEDLDLILRNTNGFGLRSIRERLLQLGGELSARRNPGDGWTVSLSLPLEAEDAREAP